MSNANNSDICRFVLKIFRFDITESCQMRMLGCYKMSRENSGQNTFTKQETK